MLVDRLSPLGRPLRNVLVDQLPPDQIGEQVAEGRPRRGAKADEQEGHREGEEEAGDDGQEDRAGNGEGLQEEVGHEDSPQDLQGKSGMKK